VPPRVTVLLCAYNAARYLQPAVESILAQTYRDFEFLLIDDASTDETPQRLTSFTDPRIRILRNERNLGLTPSLNRGLREARGELIARQDADDLSTPDRLEKQIAFLDANPSVALVGSQLRAINAAGRHEGVRDVPLTSESIHWAMLLTNPITHTAAIFRREVFRDELGGYDERFTSCQDYDLWSRASAKHRLCNLPDRLVSYRMHAESISTTRIEANQHLVREVLDRLLRERGLRKQFAEHEVTLLAKLRWGAAPADLPAVRVLLQRLDPHLPKATADAHRTLALIHAQLGYALLPHAALAGLRELARAAALSPAYAVTLPWLKICALALLGDRARRAITALRKQQPT
jgi:glycosyltransferase involved in cell wall biosynthesis